MPLLAILSTVVVSAGTSFVCTPVRVWDGDGPIWCAEGPHVRLAGIAARAMEGSCKANQPCPRASALAARNRLVALLGGARGVTGTPHILVRGPKMVCLSNGPAGGTRTCAWCNIGGRDLSCQMVASGTVLRWDRYWRRHKCP